MKKMTDSSTFHIISKCIWVTGLLLSGKAGLLFTLYSQAIVELWRQQVKKPTNTKPER